MSGPFGASQFMYATDSGFYPFEISNSLKLDSPSDTLLEKTNAGSGGSGATAGTLSCWFKYNVQDIESSQMPLIWNGSDATGISFAQSSNTPHQIYVYWGGQGALTTTAFFRDPSAWYHVVAEIDSTQGTEANRLKLYINGVATTYSGSFAQNTTSAFFNNNVAQRIGEDANNRHFDGYVADINAIEGTAYAASYFGEFKNDIWVPKDPSVTYGTNGFRLQFKNSGVGTASASTIGADTSGNTNHFTSTNIDTYDQVTDSPTNNFCTLNPIDSVISNAAFTISEGNTTVVLNGNSSYLDIGATMQVGPGGKWYWEQYNTQPGSGNTGQPLTAIIPITESAHQAATVPSGSVDLAVGTRDGNNEVYMIALDLDNGYAYRGNDGSWSNGANLSDIVSGDGTGATASSISSTMTWRPFIELLADSGSAATRMNFGTNPSFNGAVTAGTETDGNGFGKFKYAVPSGFLAVCSRNMANPHSSVDPNEGGSVQDYFQTKLYTGNGASSLDIDLDFSPEQVWIKRRNATQSHILANILSGDDKFMATNGTGQEETDNTKFRNFLTDKFRVGSHNGVNNNGSGYASWNWRAGASTASNTDGTINTTATSATPSGSFSISTFTGNGQDNATIGHGLTGVPDLVIIKPRDETDNWVVSWGNGVGTEGTITGLTSAAYFYLNTNGAMGGESNARFSANDADTVNLGNNWSNVNKNTATYTMQCFKNVQGVSRVGVYTGNGNSNGTFIYTGFRPAWLWVFKLSGGDMLLWDDQRSPVNYAQVVLYPQEDIAEQDQSSRRIDILSNGFKIRTDNSQSNTDGSNYLYLSFAKQPFKYANAR